MTIATTYHSRAAQEAEASNYGGRSYWDSLEAHAQRMHAYYADRGMAQKAVEMLTRSLSEALAGNDGN